jgi:dethiobiotin synthetase
MRIFVTGTDTNVGKTIISSWLCLHTGYAYCKPIQTGYVNGTDSDTIKQLTSSQVYQESFLYQAPLSPHLAASLENSEININHINIPNNNNIIIEGAGGIFVPINKHLFMIDLIKQINAPVKNIPILGVILNKTSNQYFQDNLKAIEWYGKTTVLAHIPKLTAINKSSLLKIAFSTQLKTIFDMAHEII